MVQLKILVCNMVKLCILVDFEQSQSLQIALAVVFPELCLLVRDLVN
jgi:hypothetical protein